MPVPADTEKVMEALLHGALLRGDATQLTLDIGDPEKNELHGEWEVAGEREKKSRTLFCCCWSEKRRWPKERERRAWPR